MMKLGAQQRVAWKMWHRNYTQVKGPEILLVHTTMEPMSIVH